MKKNGFTLIELIATFALAAVIIALLMNIVLTIKDIYVKYEIKTEMLIKQGELSSTVNDKIKKSIVTSYASCGTNCYRFVIDNVEYDLKIEDKSIKFDNYIYKPSNGVVIGNMVIADNTTVLNIKIPITHKLYPNTDFGLNLVYIK